MQGIKIKGNLIQTNMNMPRASFSISPVRKLEISPVRGGRFDKSPHARSKSKSNSNIALYKSKTIK
jgi:hypothetical protein